MRKVISGEGLSAQQSQTGDGFSSDAAPPPVRWYWTKWAFVGAVLVVLGIGAGWASLFGFLTFDSWYYLHLAKSIRLGHGCTVEGTYFAVFPCGYSVAIALTAQSLDMSSLIVSSKVMNLILLLLSFFFLTKTFENILVPLLVIVNPFTLELYEYTWSENLFLAASCASFFIIASMARSDSSRWNSLALACALIVGCSSRYFFGLFSVTIFIATWMTYGKTAALRSLPSFVAAAIFYIAYQKFNVLMTGFSTGMPRIAAPESFVFLLFRFVRQLLREMVIWGVLLLPFLWALSRTRRWATASSRPANVDSQACKLLALCGVGYLLLSFFVRTLTQYDIFPPRLISYGLIFASAALVGITTRARKNFYPAIPVLVYGAFCLLASQAEVITALASTIVSHRYVSPADAIARYRQQGVNADVIVEIMAPPIGPTIDPFPLLYYPQGAKIILIERAPYALPDTVNDLRNKVGKVHPQSCLLDFTPFQTRQDFDEFLNASFPIGFSFHSFTRMPTVVERERLDPAMRALLSTTFQPRQYVRCPF